MKPFTITSLYVSRDRESLLKEMDEYAKKSELSLNAIIWQCIEKGWASLKPVQKKTPTT